MERLDKLLLGRYPDFSRSRIEGLVKAGYVTVNGAVTLAGLAFEPWNVSETIVNKAPGHTIKFTANSIDVATLDGGAVVETANGVTAQSGTFYGTIGGAGGFTKTKIESKQ